MFKGLKEFFWVLLMGDDMSEHTTHFLWHHFAGKMPRTTYCTIYNGLGRMKEEQGSQQKKYTDAAGIDPLTSR
jgi:hypothetical protein